MAAIVFHSRQFQHEIMNEIVDRVVAAVIDK